MAECDRRRLSIPRHPAAAPAWSSSLSAVTITSTSSNTFNMNTIRCPAQCWGLATLLSCQRTFTNTRPHGRGFAGRQRPKTLTTLFGSTAQTRRLRQPRPAAAAAADQNIQFSSKSDRWGRWKSKESRGLVVTVAAGMWCLDVVWGCPVIIRQSAAQHNTQMGLFFPLISCQSTALEKPDLKNS